MLNQTTTNNKPNSHRGARIASCILGVGVLCAFLGVGSPADGWWWFTAVSLDQKTALKRLASLPRKRRSERSPRAASSRPTGAAVDSSSALH